MKTTNNTTERRYVLRKQVRPDPQQPRKEFDPAKLQSLADSFGGQVDGILESLKVREDNGAFVLIDGERRWRAAELAKLDRVPIEVIAPKDVLKTQYIFGTQRENLNALEEAQTASRLLAQRQKEQPKFTVEDLGKELGKPRATMYELLALLKISAPVREALLAGKLDASKARLFATVSPDLHTKLLKQAMEVGWDGHTMSFRELKDEIERRYSRQLGKATFSQTEVTAVAWQPGFPAKGQKGQQVTLPACERCPLRSGNIEGWEGSPNVCTSVACFEAKTKRHTDATLLLAKTDGSRVIGAKEYERARCSYVNAGDKDYDDPKSRTYNQLAAAAGIKPAVTVNSAGEILKVFTKQDVAKMHAAAGVKKKRFDYGPTPAEKAKREAEQTAIECAIRSASFKASALLEEKKTLEFARRLALTLLDAHEYELDKSAWTGRNLAHTGKHDVDVGVLRKYIETQPSWENLIGFIVQTVLEYCVTPYQNYTLKVWDVNWKDFLPGAKSTTVMLAQVKAKAKAKAAKTKPNKPAAKAKAQAATKKGKKK